MTLGLMTGCGGSEDKSSKGNNTLTVGVVQNAQITSYDDNAFTKYIEESLGIDIKFEYFSSRSSDYIQQLTLRSASGETLPDVIWGFQAMDINTMNDFGEEGYFIDLTELIEKHAPNYKAKFATLPEELQKRINRKGTSEDGAWYGMPIVAVAGIDDMQNQMYINQKWLNTLGLKAPTNLDELYTVLKAFKEKDPNGNGIDDEIPMLGKGYGETDITGYIINAFIYHDVMSRLNVDDGNVYASFTTDEYRNAIIYLNKLCSEKLLSDFCFSLSVSSEFASLITPNNGTAQVGIWCGNPEIITDTSNPVLEEYTALGWLADKTGKGGYHVVRETGLSFCSYITKDCKNPELAMKFLDIFYKDETVKRMRYGEKGVDWEEATGKSAFGNDAFIKVLNDSAFFQGNTTWGLNGNCIMTDENYYRVAETGNTKQDTVQRLARETWELQKVSPNPEEVARNLSYTSKEYQEKMEYDSAIAQYVLESRGLFITGTKDPSSDSDWQAYLETFETLGLNRFLEIVQEAYDREVAAK